ncbi:MAG: hypothetical protein RLZ23_140, partial [Actinomycetota bacterium]
IHVEAGITIINELLEANLVDALELSITEVSGGEDKIDIEKLLAHFGEKSEQSIAGTRIISARK